MDNEALLATLLLMGMRHHPKVLGTWSVYVAAEEDIRLVGGQVYCHSTGVAGAYNYHVYVQHPSTARIVTPSAHRVIALIQHYMDGTLDAVTNEATKRLEEANGL